MASCITCAIFIYDRLEGLWNRSLVAGVSMVKILTAHVIVNGLIIVFMSIEILVAVMFMYNIDNRGSNFTAIILVVLVDVCGMLYGLCISVACDTYRTATMVTAGCKIKIANLKSMFK